MALAMAARRHRPPLLLPTPAPAPPGKPDCPAAGDQAAAEASTNRGRLPGHVHPEVHQCRHRSRTHLHRRAAGQEAGADALELRRAGAADVSGQRGRTSGSTSPRPSRPTARISKASQLPAAVSFLMGKGKLSDEFEITLAKELPYGEAAGPPLGAQAARSRSPPTRPFTSWSTPRRYLVRQSVLINTQGDINAITFSDVRLNSKLADAISSGPRLPEPGSSRRQPSK